MCVCVRAALAPNRVHHPLPVGGRCAEWAEVKGVESIFLMHASMCGAAVCVSVCLCVCVSVCLSVCFAFKWDSFSISKKQCRTVEGHRGSGYNVQCASSPWYYLCCACICVCVCCVCVCVCVCVLLVWLISQ